MVGFKTDTQTLIKICDELNKEHWKAIFVIIFVNNLVKQRLKHK